MEKIKDQIKSELRQLPFMLGKLLGAAMAVIGFPWAIIIITRKPNASFSDLLPFLFTGISGIAVFMMSSWLLIRRGNEDKSAAPQKNKYRISLISWLIFSALSALFLLITYLVTK